MNWLQGFLYGRNGIDNLGVTALVLGGVLLIVSSVTGIAALSVLYLVCVMYALFRILSRDIHGRRRENIRFLSIFSTIKTPFKLRLRMIRERKTHRFLRCPTCQAWLRVPKGRGKLNIRCSKCGIQFIRKV